MKQIFDLFYFKMESNKSDVNMDRTSKVITFSAVQLGDGFVNTWVKINFMDITFIESKEKNQKAN